MPRGTLSTGCRASRLDRTGARDRGLAAIDALFAGVPLLTLAGTPSYSRPD